MKREEFYKLVTEATSEMMRLLEEKGRAYSGEGDVFDNFKRNADAMGLTKYQVWLVYCSKHFDAIRNAVKQNPSQPIDKSEGLVGRIDDAINYLNLLRGMLKEDQGEPFVIPDTLKQEYSVDNGKTWFPVHPSSPANKFTKNTIFR